MAAAASAKYNAGDVILGNCKPFCKSLSPTLRHVRCSNCLDILKGSLICNTCSLLHYCNEKCKNEDWQNGHKLECKLWKDKKYYDYCHSHPNANDVLFVVRTFAMLKLNPEMAQKTYTLVDGTTRRFGDMTCIDGDEFAQEHKATMCRTLAKNITKLNADEPEYKAEAEDLIPLFGMFKFILVSEVDMSQIGICFFIESSFMEHSCIPNAVCVNDGLNLQIRAIHPIKEGQKPTICFLGTHETKRVRQTMLLNLINIECACEKCTTNSDSEIDYAKLLGLVNDMRKFHETAFQADWRDVYRTHNEILDIFRKLYNEYDERITIQFIRAYEIAIALRIHKIQLRKLRFQTREHLVKTYGIEHRYFKDFKNKSDKAF